MFKYGLIDLKTVDKTLKNKQLAKKKGRIIHNNYRIKVLKQLARLIKLTISNSIASKGLIKNVQLTGIYSLSSLRASSASVSAFSALPSCNQHFDLVTKHFFSSGLISMAYIKVSIILSIK